MARPGRMSPLANCTLIAREVSNDPEPSRPRLGTVVLTWAFCLERVTGIEPALSAWESVPSGPVTWPDLRGRVSASDRERPLFSGVNGPLMARRSSSDLRLEGLRNLDERGNPNRISSSERSRSDRFKLDRLPWPVCPTRHGMAWNCNLNCNPEDRWVHWPLCAYRHSMDATLAWTIVGSVAGVAAVVSGVGFGVAQVRQGRAKTGVAGADGPLAGLADAYVSSVTGPVAGPTTLPGVVLAGEVPQEPPSFQPREDLIAAMRRSAPRMAVVQVVTGCAGLARRSWRQPMPGLGSARAGGWWHG